jgi:hypothetical protein
VNAEHTIWKYLSDDFFNNNKTTHFLSVQPIVKWCICRFTISLLWECYGSFISFNYNCMQDWDRQNPTQIVTEMCGFVTILSGTFLLHKTKDMVDGMTTFPRLLTCSITKILPLYLQ